APSASARMAPLLPRLGINSSRTAPSASKAGPSRRNSSLADPVPPSRRVSARADGADARPARQTQTMSAAQRAYAYGTDQPPARTTAMSPRGAPPTPKLLKTSLRSG